MHNIRAQEECNDEPLRDRLAMIVATACPFILHGGMQRSH